MEVETTCLLVFQVANEDLSISTVGLSIRDPNGSVWCYLQTTGNDIS